MLHARLPIIHNLISMISEVKNEKQKQIGSVMRAPLFSQTRYQSSVDCVSGEAEQIKAQPNSSWIKPCLNQIFFHPNSGNAAENGAPIALPP